MRELEAGQLLDSLSTAALRLGPDWQIRALNTAAEQLLGHSRRQLLGSSLQLWLPAVNPLWALLERARAEQRRVQQADLEWLLPLQQSHRAHIVITPDGDEWLLEALPADEAHRLHDETLRREQAERLLAVLRNLAHEIKNPLAGLRGAAQLLALELADPALREYTDLIQREADRLRALVDRLLQPTRQPAQDVINIHQLLDDAQRLVGAGFNLQWKRDYDPSLPDLHGSRDALMQVLINLLQNAAEALRDAGTANPQIILRTRSETGALIATQRVRLALRLDVIDNGPGIPASMREQLFVPLCTSKPYGSGLGLALVQQLMQQMGGAVHGQSEAGQTRFTLLLPFAMSPS